MSFLEEFRSISTGEKTQRETEIEKGKKSFRQYCNMINNDFFKKREHIKILFVIHYKKCMKEK